MLAGSPAKKHGWVVRAQPASSKQVNPKVGSTVQMLRQTWDRPADQPHDKQTYLGSQGDPGTDGAASRFQAQLQASMADRRGRFSSQL